MVSLAPVKLDVARGIFEKHSDFRGEFNLAIAASDEQGKIKGVIAMTADGETFALAHLWTDASAQIGSLLYGGAWRVAKALGYKTITI